jgi:hypothetical protein
MFIEDPERMKSWNPKSHRISSISRGERAVGYRYRITYEMRKKTNEFFSGIIEYRKPGLGSGLGLGSLGLGSCLSIDLLVLPIRLGM